MNMRTRKSRGTRNSAIEDRVIDSRAARQPAVWMMNIAVLLISVCGAPVFADGKPVDETLPASAKGHVEISVVRGDLEVRGWDKDEIHVVGTLDEQMTEFVFDVDTDSAIIAVRVPMNTNHWCCDEGANLVIYVPEGSQVNVSSVSTDVRSHDVKGGLDVGGVSGDVDLENVGERVTVSSVSGDVDVNGARGRVRLKSVSGDVHGVNIEGPMNIHSVSGALMLRGVAGDVDVKTVSGDIDVQQLSFNELRGSSISGNIEVGGEVFAGGMIECDTISGNIRLTFEGSDVSARFDLDTRSGSIQNRVNTERPAVAKNANRESLRMVVGAGDADVVLHTRSGDIVISK
jgi:hypothetical protein